MTTEHTPRSAADSQAERTYLERRLSEVDRYLGQLAARLGTPTPITQELDTLDRARELAGELLMEINVRTLDEAMSAKLAWLDRMEARQANRGGEPAIALRTVALDRRLVEEIRRGWETRRR
jgi:hypothetical protein